MCVPLSLSAVHAVPHSDTNTNKGSLLCVNGEPVSSLRQRLLRGLTQRPQSPWRTDQLQCTSTPASLTHKSELTSACQPRWKIYLSCLFLWLTIFFLCHPFPGMSERERQVMKKLKEVVDKQRDEIRAKDRELTLKNEDIEAVRTQTWCLNEKRLFFFFLCEL